MLRSAKEMREHPPDKIIPCVDPLLKHNRRQYLRFIHRLQETDFLYFSKFPKCRAGTFFVGKSDGQIRMTIDGRRANRMFKTPPEVDLCTAEGLGRTEVSLPKGVTPWSQEGKAFLNNFGLCLGLADAGNCFHRCKQPFWLSEHFAMEPVLAKEVGLTGKVVSGITMQADDVVYPRPGSLCMGFPWSLYFAQQCSEVAMTACPRQALCK